MGGDRLAMDEGENSGIQKCIGYGFAGLDSKWVIPKKLLTLCICTHEADHDGDTRKISAESQDLCLET